MSYARFGSDGSDVYVYEHYAGFIECCGCALSTSDEEDDWFFHANTAREILEHLDAHRAVGHTVLDRTYDRIKEEHPNLDAQIPPYVEDPERAAAIKARMMEIFGEHE